jgi:hypothetical protein
MLKSNFLSEKVVKKAPFWKSRKSEMAPKSNFSVKIGTGTLFKRSPGAVLKKHEKTTKFQLKMRGF